MTKRTVQQIVGYLIGGMIFLLGIPYGLYQASRAWDRFFGWQLIPIPGLRLAVAIFLVLVGLLFAVWSLVIQNAIGQGGPLEGKGIGVSPKTKQLVITGPYKYTRNPMLFGTCAMYFGVAICLNSMAAALIAAFFTTFMVIFVKLTEEKRLLADFGQDYEAYRHKVSFFIHWF